MFEFHQKLWEELLKQAEIAIKNGEGHVKFGRQMEKAGFFLDFRKPTGCEGISDQEFVSTVINHLNAVAGTTFRTKVPSPNAILILNWRKKGHNDTADFKAVVDKNWKRWQGTVYAEAMTPQTLFGKKFENYLGQKISNVHSTTTQGLPDKLDQASAGAKRPVPEPGQNKR